MNNAFFKILLLFLLFVNLTSADIQEFGNIDDSYTYGSKELKGIMINNYDIKSYDRKPILLVFGQEGCYYCKLLIKNVTSNDVMKEYLINNFSPYYIDITHKKRHKVDLLQLDGITSRDFARLYNLSATPMIVFISPRGEVIMRIQGYPGEDVLFKSLEYIANDKWKVYKTETNRIKGFLSYANLDQN